MVTLIRYEIRKCFWKKSILLLLSIFTLINLVSIYGTYRDNSEFDEFPKWKEFYPTIYEQVKGEMTVEKIHTLLSIYRPIEIQVADRTASTATDNPNTYTGNIYSDYYFFYRNFVMPMEYLYTYQIKAQEIADAAQSNLSLYSCIGNDYEYRKNKMIAELYENRIIRDFTFTSFYNSFVHYDLSILLVLLISLYALAGVFVLEKESEMEYLLLTMKQGGWYTTMAKLFASVIFVMVVSLWFWLMDFFGFAVIYGTMNGGSMPVYTLENFVQSAVQMPMLQYALLSIVVKTLGAVIMGFIFVLISQFFRTTLFPYVLGLLTIFALAELYSIYVSSSHVILKICNPFVLLQCRAIFRVTEFVNFFGIPVFSYQAALFCGVVWCVLLLLTVSILTKKNAVEKRGEMQWNFLHLR